MRILVSAFLLVAAISKCAQAAQSSDPGDPGKVSHRHRAADGTLQIDGRAASPTQAPSGNKPGCAQKCARGKDVFVVSARNGSGFGDETIVKNSAVCIVDLNPVKFGYSLDPTVTAVKDSVDLGSLGFIPKPASTGTPTSTPKSISTPALAGLRYEFREPTRIPEPSEPLENEFHRLADQVDLLGTGNPDDKLTPVQTRVTTLTDFTNRAKTETDDFRKSDDNYDRQAARSGMIRLLNTFIYPLADDNRYEWPDQDIQTLQNLLNQLQSGLEALPTTYSDVWTTWSKLNDHLNSYNRVLARVKDVQSQLKTINGGRKAWEDIRDALIAVGEHFDHLLDDATDPFTIVFCQACGIFGKKTELKLNSQDLTDSKAKPDKKTLLTLECASPLSLSGGFAVSTLDERDYELAAPPAPAGASTTKTSGNVVINLNSQSRFHPYPLLLLNIRLVQLSPSIALHYSFGSGVDLTTGKIGTDWELLTGPSLAVANRLFFTIGPDVGRTPALIPGFVVGPPGYTGLQQAPIQKHWNTGLALAFTFKLK